MESERKEEESRMKECLSRGARKTSLMRKEQMLYSIEGGDISSVVQEGPKPHSGVGYSIQDGRLGPEQRVGEEGVPDINFVNFVIKERSQTIETAVTEVRQGLRRKGK